MILAILKHDYDTYLEVYETWDAFHADVFSPEVDVEWAWDGKAHGKSYADKKSYIREQAIEYSNAVWSADYNWSTFAEASSLLEKYGRRYGLMTEFKENCICFW